MKTAERLFWAAVTLQLLHLVSVALSTEWMATAVFVAWVAIVPVIGFVIGKSGGTAARAGRVAATLALSWFFLGSLGVLFWENVSPDLWLTGFAGFAISCIIGGAVLFLFAFVSAKVGARLSAAA